MIDMAANNVCANYHEEFCWAKILTYNSMFKITCFRRKAPLQKIYSKGY